METVKTDQIFADWLVGTDNLTNCVDIILLFEFPFEGLLLLLFLLTINNRWKSQVNS